MEFFSVQVRALQAFPSLASSFYKWIWPLISCLAKSSKSPFLRAIQGSHLIPLPFFPHCTSGKSLEYLLQILCNFILEKEMATHSSVLAWRIPGMGEPGGLPSMGLRRVGHNWSDLAAAAAVVVSSSVEGDNNHTCLIRLWWGLNHFIHVKGLELCLTHSKRYILDGDILCSSGFWGE